MSDQNAPLMSLRTQRDNIEEDLIETRSALRRRIEDLNKLRLDGDALEDKLRTMDRAIELLSPASLAKGVSNQAPAPAANPIQGGSLNLAGDGKAKVLIDLIDHPQVTLEFPAPPDGHPIAAAFKTLASMGYAHVEGEATWRMPLDPPGSNETTQDLATAEANGQAPVEHKLYTERASTVRAFLQHGLADCKPGRSMHLSQRLASEILDLLYPTKTPAAAGVPFDDPFEDKLVRLKAEFGATGPMRYIGRDGVTGLAVVESAAGSEISFRADTLEVVPPSEGGYPEETPEEKRELEAMPPKIFRPVIAYPARRLVLTVTHPTIGDRWFAPEVATALFEFAPYQQNAESLDALWDGPRPAYPFTASNGVIVDVEPWLSVDAEDQRPGEASIAAAAQAAEGLYAPGAVEATAEEEEAFNRLPIRVVRKTPIKVNQTYDFEQFMAYGREQLSKTHAAVADIPWSFNFEGHSVTHENDSRYLIEGNSPGTQFIFNRGDILTFDPASGQVSIKSPATPDALAPEVPEQPIELDMGDITARALDTLKVPMLVAAKPEVIKPTIGRRVWFHTGNTVRDGFTIYDEQPLDAGIVYVWSDRMVNLDVTDHAGKHHAFTSVRLMQPDEEGALTPKDGYCVWMPYQVGQAKAAK